MLEIIKNLLKRTGTLFSEVKNIKKRLLFLEENSIEIPETPEAPKEYIVYFSGGGEDEIPIVIQSVLKNTLGEITITQSDPYTYRVTSDNLFTDGKTEISVKNIFNEHNGNKLGIFLEESEFPNSIMFTTTENSPLDLALIHITVYP